MRVVEELAQVRADLEKASAEIAELKAAAVAAQEKAAADLAEKDAKIAELESEKDAARETADALNAEVVAQSVRADKAEEAAKAEREAMMDAMKRAATAEAVLEADPSALSGRVAGTDPVEGTAGGARPATWDAAVKEVGYARARREFGDLYAEAFPKLAGRRA